MHVCFQHFEIISSDAMIISTSGSSVQAYETIGLKHFGPIVGGRGGGFICTFSIHICFQHVYIDHVEVKLSRCYANFNLRLFCGSVWKPKSLNPKFFSEQILAKLHVSIIKLFS